MGRGGCRAVGQWLLATGPVHIHGSRRRVRVERDPVAREPPVEDLLSQVDGWLEIVVTRALGDPDDARDAIQEILARALEAIRGGRVPDGLSLAPFVYGIARHVIADALGKRAREADHSGEISAVASPGPSALEELVSRESRLAMRRALDRLPRAERAILERCYVDGERVVDIASRMGEPADRIRKRKSRALQHLREILTRDDAPASHTSRPDLTSSSR